MTEEIRNPRTRRQTQTNAGKHAGEHLAERVTFCFCTTAPQEVGGLKDWCEEQQGQAARQQSAPLPQARLAPLLWTPRTCLLQRQSNLSGFIAKCKPAEVHCILHGICL